MRRSVTKLLMFAAILSDGQAKPGDRRESGKRRMDKTFHRSRIGERSARDPAESLQNSKWADQFVVFCSGDKFSRIQFKFSSSCRRILQSRKLHEILLIFIVNLDDFF